MTWTSIATPEYLGRKPRNRRVVLNPPVTSGFGSYSNVNMVSQVYRGRMDAGSKDTCCTTGWTTIRMCRVHSTF